MQARSLFIFITSVIAIALLVVACGNKRSSRRASIYPATVVPARRTLPPLPVRPLSPELQAVRDRTAKAAGATRELEWRDDVGMTELSGWEYGTRTREMAEVLGGDDLRALSRLAVAGGVLPEGTDLATLAASFTAASAGATYSPLDKQVLLLADGTPSDSLLTHELVHALQDQHFDLLSLLLARPYNFDRTEAVFAVIEGDAINVQRRIENGDAWTRRSLEEITRQEDERFGEYRREVGQWFPPLLTETFIFRYRDGARFVETVRRSRGEAGVNELFQHPPQSSEQILHPEKYMSNSSDVVPRDISIDEAAFAASGWQVAASTPLGETGVRGLLMKSVSSKDAMRAAAGWGGDRAYLFERQGGTPLFVWKSVWDKREDAAEFFKAYKALRRSGRNEPAGDAGKIGEEAQTIWREAGLLTVVRRSADSVIVLRGLEADVQSVIELAVR